MTRWSLSRCALSLSVAAALLAGCGGSQASMGASGAMPRSGAIGARGDSASYKILYSFNGKPDAHNPLASLVEVHGTLYGTTGLGGTYKHSGTVFSITTGGTEQVLHDFTRYPDGADPLAGLVDVNGTLYGTTYKGGGEARGTVFSVTTGGVEQVLHRFDGKGTHGGHPAAALIDVGGTLYGTTEVGGMPHFKGTVFKITPGGNEKELYRFGSPGDGAFPVASLVDVGGTLYGTTASGGTYDDGIVFSMTTGGKEKVLHSFGKGHDGKNPQAALIDVGGRLYGTTYSGGEYHKGTVFSITTSGAEFVAYSFGANGSDGSGPNASLLDAGGTLYGTTAHGGSGSACYAGCGIVYSINTSFAETVLHDFTGGSDGANPNAGLLDVAGVLYGTTTFGGSASQCRHYGGCGTVFALTP